MDIDTERIRSPSYAVGDIDFIRPVHIVGRAYRSIVEINFRNCIYAVKTKKNTVVFQH